MPRSSQSEEERAETRRRILAAARALFQEEGIEAVSMRAIGRRVGLTAAALYGYFPSKAALLRGLWHDALGDLTARLRAISAGLSDPIAAIRALAEAYAAFAGEDQVRFRVLFRHDEAISEEEWPEIHAPYLLLREQVAEAMRRGRFGAAEDPDLLAQAIWGAAHGVLALQADCREFEFRPMKLLVATVLEAMLAGLTAEPVVQGRNAPCAG
jgi:AcrR family transcriptional regulator